MKFSSSVKLVYLKFLGISYVIYNSILKFL